ncbi:MAG: DUF559 domain-containing protein [Candidatus Dojkabacteria bacterium]|nr:DUF559 domain-containing protein [Candidatus Dojkabacteria bacterium]MDQ7021690.1 DUF559 domain-containing protein [Candidatus Dojkabacteria bacterium]
MRRIKKFARENRTNMAKSENILWQEIRRDKLGVRVLRQKVIGRYIVDFYIAKYKLVIEVDGEVHLSRREYDVERTRVLNGMGYRVVRFWNYEIMSNVGGVVERIKLWLLQHPSQPSFRGREDRIADGENE